MGLSPQSVITDLENTWNLMFGPMVPKITRSRQTARRLLQCCIGTSMFVSDLKIATSMHEIFGSAKGNVQEKFDDHIISL